MRDTINHYKMARVAISGKTLPEIEKLIQEIGEPAFRARQLHSWIYSKQSRSFDEMTDLSDTCRQKLANIAQIPLLRLSHLQVSKDLTRKYLFTLPDEHTIEAVLMSFSDRTSLSACVSSQVGCAIGCTFCATGYLDFTRNLTAQEIVDQVMSIQRESGQRVANVVYMGQGEPLLNVEEIIKSLHILIDSVGIGARHLTISTAGIVPGIKRLAEEKLPITLALSLHAPDKVTREQIVPIAKKYQLPELMKSLRDYAQATGRRVTIEYVLLKGVTDTPEQAQALAELVRDLHCNINLIPYNPTLNAFEKPLYSRPNRQSQLHFKQIAQRTGKTVTIRLERGADIDAACGQLHNKLSGQ